MGIHAGLQRKKSVYQLLLTHFQTENRHREIQLESDMLGNIQHKCRFAHGRTGRNQHQVGGLQTRCPVIQIQKACGNTRNRSLLSGSRLNPVHGVHHHLPNRSKVLGIALLYKLEHLFFRILQNVLQTFFPHIAGIGDLLVQPDQFAQGGLFSHNIGIIFDIGRSGHHPQQIPDELQAAHLRRHILLLQLVLQCDQIHRITLVVEFHHSLKQDAILLIVEIVPQDNLRSHHNGLPVHDHGTDHRLLCLHAVGQNPLNRYFIHTFFPQAPMPLSLLQ